MANKIKIKHLDGITDVMANVYFLSNCINLEYKYRGMDYGRTIDILEAVRMGIIECNHSSDKLEYYDKSKELITKATTP